jgi:DNA (cytosine-5)-methyltransferase 1
MTHGSLFSGIGGFDLAAEWMGWENVFHCEWNEFGKKVLNYYWPKAISYHDITKTDFTIHRGKIDVLTGGFPCQPYSSAGKRKGKEDERHLWPQMLRAIREIQPRWVVGENVLGLVNWSGGLVFHEVQADLEAAGYEVFPYVLPAVSVNAPHRRDRVWFVAYATGNGYKNGHKETGGEKRSSEQRGLQQFERMGGQRFTPHPNGNEYGNVADTDSRGLEGSVEVGRNCEYVIGENGTSSQTGDVADTDLQRYDKFKFTAITNKPERFNSQKNIIGEPGGWQNFPTQSPVRFGDDGLSSRLDNITFSKWRNESIKAAGNAIVPQVALQIFKTIQQYETLPRMADKI